MTNVFFPPMFLSWLHAMLKRRFDHIPALVQHFNIHIKHYAIHAFTSGYVRSRKNIVHEKLDTQLLFTGVNTKKVTTKERGKKGTPYTLHSRP